MRKHIAFAEKQKLTSYRKIAIASWQHPRNPATYCPTELTYDAAREFLKAYPSTTPPTVTHYATKILAHCLEQYPQLNHVLRWGNLHRRAGVNIFISTLLRTSKGKDLTGFLVPDVNTLSLAEVADRSEKESALLRQPQAHETMRAQRALERLPAMLLRPLMRLQEFLHYTLNLSLAGLGIPDDPFGSAMVTNVGGLGFENAFIPLSPYSRCPLIVSVGRPHEAPVVRDGEVRVGTRICITFTFDHRYADGAHGAPFFRRFRKVFENPTAFPQVFTPPRPEA